MIDVKEARSGGLLFCWWHGMMESPVLEKISSRALTLSARETNMRGCRLVRQSLFENRDFEIARMCEADSVNQARSASGESSNLNIFK